MSRAALGSADSCDRNHGAPMLASCSAYKAVREYAYINSKAVKLKPCASSLLQLDSLHRHQPFTGMVMWRSVEIRLRSQLDTNHSGQGQDYLRSDLHTLLPLWQAWPGLSSLLGQSRMRWESRCYLPVSSWRDIAQRLYVRDPWCLDSGSGPCMGLCVRGRCLRMLSCCRPGSPAVGAGYWHDKQPVTAAEY